MPDANFMSDMRAELVGFVRSRVSDAATAEDIVHNALLKGMQKSESIRDPGRIRPWLFQITRNLVADYYRSRPTMRALDQDAKNLTVDAEVDAVDAARGMALCASRMVSMLPEEYTRVIVASELEERKHRDIADEIGISVSGVKSRVQRGRARLRDLVSQCCDMDVNDRGQVLDHSCHRDCGCERQT